MQTISQRRVLGSFYTPEWIANWMVFRALPKCDAAVSSTSLRVLDAACGDGAFVLPVLEWIARLRGISADDTSGRLQIVRQHLFGVDADPQAIVVLHRRIAAWIGEGSSNEVDVALALAANFQHGDALLGADWSRTRPDPNSVSSTRAADQRGSTAQPIDWHTAFPQVAAEGGFDLVIGNPPYRRELNAKREFDRIANSALGKRWRTARMDLWHYFFHRGLDLLKPGGRLSFIVNSYWTESTAAKPMRERMTAETSIEELVFFGAVRLFRDVSGRHMIFRLRKSRMIPLAAMNEAFTYSAPAIKSRTFARARYNDQTCRILNLENLSHDKIVEALNLEQHSNTPIPAVAILRQSELWKGGSLRSEVPAPEGDFKSRGLTLGDVFEVRQGMAENPPFVTKGAAQELGESVVAGEGIFVLSEAEIAGLRLSNHEQTLLRPYYALSSIGRFQIPLQPSHYVLYLTRNTAPTLAELPQISKHLQRFRPILERRREARAGKIAWWHLHWPREERLFTTPRVLCIQMGHVPRFAYAEQPTFVGFSLHVIVRRQVPSPSSITSLAALTALLNSSRAKQWFMAHAKRRGVHLDISGTVLKRFPLPGNIPSELEAELDRMARVWPASRSESEAAEQRLDTLADLIYVG